MVYAYYWVLKNGSLAFLKCLQLLKIMFLHSNHASSTVYFKRSSQTHSKELRRLGYVAQLHVFVKMQFFNISTSSNNKIWYQNILL